MKSVHSQSPELNALVECLVRVSAGCDLVEGFDNAHGDSAKELVQWVSVRDSRKFPSAYK